MGWLEMVAVLLVTAIAAGAGGFWASVLARRKKPRARAPFLVGVLCGLMAGVALTGRRQGLTALGASTLKAVIRQPWPGIGLLEFRKRCLATGSRILRTRGLRSLLLILMVLATAGAVPLALPAAAGADTGADKVFVGAFVKDLQDVDLASESFTVDFYLWLRWTNPKINPSATIEAMNSNGFQNTTTSSTGGVAPKPLYDAPVDLPDGSKYMLLRYQGVFSRKLMLQNYPFDTQVLRIVLKDERADARKLEYVPDKKPISIARSLLLSIPGFSLGSPTLVIVAHQYETDFGDTSASAEIPYSCIRIEIPVARNPLPYLVKIVLPILIVIFVTSLIYALPARLEEARAGIGITALLTIVALQWSAESSLPSVEYLTMLDVIYIVSMIYIAAAIGYTVLASRRNRHEMAQALTAAVDRRVGLISLAAYVILIAATMYLHLHQAHPVEFFP